MNKKEALNILNLEKKNSIRVSKEDVIEAFRTFWNSNPTEKEFGDVMSGIIIYAEMIYIMNMNSIQP